MNAGDARKIDVELTAALALALARQMSPTSHRPGAPPCPHWLFLSPLTLRVVRLLCGTDWLSKEVIASRLNEQPEGKLAGLLTDLAERHVLESSTRKGYMLAIPDDAEPEAFRQQLLGWLAAQEAEAVPPLRVDLQRNGHA